MCPNGCWWHNPDVPLTNSPKGHMICTVSFPGRLTAAILAHVLVACTGQGIQRKDGSQSARSFSITQLAKGDVDTVCEIHQGEALASLRLLTEKLYKRNPQEWRKAGSESSEAATARIFDHLHHWHMSALKDSDWQASIRLAFQDDYEGDRVHALMVGVAVMVMASYNHKTEFYLLDELDAQKLYNSARNIEVTAWKLSNARNNRGELLLLSNAMDEGGPHNLSFEREFGKLIAIQDTLAKVVEDKSNRTLRRAMTNAASLIFLPI
jgi:hypothetical protein